MLDGKSFTIGDSQPVVMFVISGVQNIAAGSNFISCVLWCVRLYVLKSLPRRYRVTVVVLNLDSNKHGYVKQYIFCEVWNSDRCGAVSCGRNVPPFWTNLLSPSSDWKNSNIFFCPEDTSRPLLWNAWKFLLDYMVSQCSL